MRILVTGITGLIGSHLARYLTGKENVEVFGFKRWRSPEDNIEDLLGKISFIEGDIQDFASVRGAVKMARPDWVFHLAAQSYPKESLAAPHITFRINVEGTINLLEAIRNWSPSSKVHIASSSAAYGFVNPEDVPISEDHPLRPLSPYGVSKVAQEHLAYQYFKNYGITTYIARFFNQAGPGQNERSAIQTFSKQAAMIEKGKQKPIIYVGNLKAKRDYTDIRDTVRALWLLMQKGEAGQIYNIGSGKSTVIGDLLDLVLDKVKLKVEIKIDKDRLRPSDEPVLEADIAKFRHQTGWEPRYTMENTVESVVEFWRRHV